MTSSLTAKATSSSLLVDLSVNRRKVREGRRVTEVLRGAARWARDLGVWMGGGISLSAERNEKSFISAHASEDFKDGFHKVSQSPAARRQT
eukprot:768566-Hanusia_phi.AAC.7